MRTGIVYIVAPRASTCKLSDVSAQTPRGLAAVPPLCHTGTEPAGDVQNELRPGCASRFRQRRRVRQPLVSPNKTSPEPHPPDSASFLSSSFPGSRLIRIPIACPLSFRHSLPLFTQWTRVSTRSLLTRLVRTLVPLANGDSELTRLSATAQQWSPKQQQPPRRRRQAS